MIWWREINEIVEPYLLEPEDDNSSVRSASTLLNLAWV